MRRAGFPVAAVGLLAACNPSMNTALPAFGPRAAAQEAALQYVMRRDPVIDPAPVAACLANNATAEEARALAAGGAIGDTVSQIVRRRGTQDCFTDAGVPDFGLDLLTA